MSLEYITVYINCVDSTEFWWVVYAFCVCCYLPLAITWHLWLAWWVGDICTVTARTSAEAVLESPDVWGIANNIKEHTGVVCWTAKFWLRICIDWQILSRSTWGNWFIYWALCRFGGFDPIVCCEECFLQISYLHKWRQSNIWFNTFDPIQVKCCQKSYLKMFVVKLRVVLRAFLRRLHCMYVRKQINNIHCSSKMW